MRLICPNCSAQYEIDAALVPDEGRDVQCSNCGHTWFELPPADFSEDEMTPAEIAGSAQDTPASETPIEEIDPPADAPSHAALAIAAASEDTGEAEDDAFVFDGPAPPPPGIKPGQRRPADAAALDILKEEAAREMSRRRAPPSEAFESQSDLGLDVLRERRATSRALKARQASRKDSPLPETSDAVPVPPSGPDQPPSKEVFEPPRRDLLPDIDEINSTLNATRKPAKTGAEAAQSRKGFRRGFLTMTLIALAMILAYAQAPAIARILPGSEAALIPYVDGANVVRDWIDGMLGKGA